MVVFFKVIQIAAGGVGFFVGYFWSVFRWTEHATSAADPILRASISPGIFLAALYAAILACLFCQWLPSSKTSTIRAMISPIVFSFSFLIGAFGIWAALGILSMA